MQAYTDLKTNILKDKEVKTHYKQLDTKYSLISQVIETRINEGISQQTLAKKMGTKQSAISRFESGNYNPSLDFIIKISKALNVRLVISLR